ncbi:hypothetical protein PIB30_038096 [Stylosanthes scabra]|uniref:Uncharacterized protein n=1 Tax=Stylosanthes scabra TaxID=79078 RepID=A0ABU6ZCG2_9FABA|nr:hypothetical protein [Stylosanthes scabra]
MDSQLYANKGAGRSNAASLSLSSTFLAFSISCSLKHQRDQTLFVHPPPGHHHPQTPSPPAIVSTTPHLHQISKPHRPCFRSSSESSSSFTAHHPVSASSFPLVAAPFYSSSLVVPVDPPFCSFSSLSLPRRLRITSSLPSRDRR